MANTITIESTIHAPIERVWECWNNPEHIVKWCHASDDWHTVSSVNDVEPGGKFNNRMEAKDGSAGFDFSGVYDDVELNKRLAYTLDDGRKVEVIFEIVDEGTHVIQNFEPEQENPVEMQKDGWQAILDSFKKYTETL